MKRGIYRFLFQSLSFITLILSVPVCAQTPSQQEMEEAMRQMREQMDQLTPEQRMMLEQGMQQMSDQAAPGAEDEEITVPKRDAARIAAVSKKPLTGMQLKAYVEQLQPKIDLALAPYARQRAKQIETEMLKSPDTLSRQRAVATGLAAWGAWPEAIYMMGKVALASGDAQDLNNLAAFLTMQKAAHAALPILISLNARYPDNSTVLNNLGQAWFELGDIEEAERVLILAVRYSPTHPQANVTKSHIEEARGDKQAAQASMHAAIRGGFSEEKMQRLNRLGGKLMPGDARWRLDAPAHPLGLSDLAVPEYPSNAEETVGASRRWQAYRQQLEETGAQLKLKVGRAAMERASTALSVVRPGMRIQELSRSAGEMLRFHAPLAPLATEVLREEEAAAKREEQKLLSALADAERVEEQQLTKLKQRLQSLRLQPIPECVGRAESGCPPELYCRRELPLVNDYLDKVIPQLDHAARALVQFQHRRLGDVANLMQYTMSDLEFDRIKDGFRLDFLKTVGRAHGLIIARHGFFKVGGFNTSCLTNPKAKPPKVKLLDFDAMNCQHVISFAVPGIGHYEIECNSAHVVLDPFALPLKVAWAEDLIKDRVVNASVEIDIAKGVKVSGHGEFDDDGLVRGDVGVGVTGKVVSGTDVGPRDVRGGSKAGPLEIGGKIGATVTVDFDRSGVTDVRVEGKVGAEATSGIDGTGAGTQVTTEVKGNWSWNGGTSASVSGGFDRSLF